MSKNWFAKGPIYWWVLAGGGRIGHKNGKSTAWCAMGAKSNLKVVKVCSAWPHATTAQGICANIGGASNVGHSHTAMPAAAATPPPLPAPLQPPALGYKPATPMANMAFAQHAALASAALAVQKAKHGAMASTKLWLCKPALPLGKCCQQPQTGKKRKGFAMAAMWWHHSTA